MNLNNREQLLTLGVSLALLAVFAFGLAIPRSTTLGEVRQQNTALQRHNEDLVRETTFIAAEHQEVERLKKELRLAQSRVPLEDRFAEYENDLLRLGEEHGLWDPATEPEIIDTKPGGEERESDIETRTVKLSFESGFDEFYGFLRAVERQTRLTRVERVEIRPADQYGVLFKIELELSIFYGQL